MNRYVIYNETFKCFEQDENGDSREFNGLSEAFQAVAELFAEDTDNREFSVMEVSGFTEFTVKNA